MKLGVRIFGGLVILLIVVIGAALVMVKSVDVSSYQNLVTDRVAKATGRTLTIGGPVEVELALSPSISATDIRLSNADWGSAPDMLTVARFETRLALIPLLFGEQKIEYIMLDGVDLLVETNADGGSNWQFADDATTPSDVRDGKTAGGLPQITDIVLQNVRVVQPGRSVDGGAVAVIQHAKVHVDDLRTPIQISVDASWRDVPISATGELGAPVILTHSDAPYPVSLTLSGDEIQGKVGGTIGEPLQGRDLNLTFETAIASQDTVDALFGPGAPRLAPLSVTGSIIGAPANIQLGALRVGIGGIQLTGQVGYDTTGARPKLTANLNSELIAVAELLAMVPGGQVAPAADQAAEQDDPAPDTALKDLDAEITLAVGRLVADPMTLLDVSAKAALSQGVLAVSPMSFSIGQGDSRGDVGGTASIDLAGARPSFDVALSASRLDLARLLPPGDGTESNRIFSDAPFQLDILRRADGRLRVDGKNLTYGSVSVPELTFDAALAAGELTVKPFAVIVAGSRVEGTIGLKAGDVPDLRITAASDSLDVGRVLSETGMTTAVRGKARTDVAVSGQGVSMAALMTGLNGHARMLMSEGRIKTDGLNLAVDGLQTVLGTMFTGDADWATVNCAAADFVIDHGIAEPRALVADTEFSTVVGEGDINLGTERIDMLFTPESKEVTLNIAVPVTVEGPLSGPAVGLDETALATRVGSAFIGSLIFPPAVLAGFVDLGGDRDNPCLNPEARVTTAPGDRVLLQVEEVLDDAGETVGDAVEGAGEAVGDLIEGVGEGIGDLFSDD